MYYLYVLKSLKDETPLVFGILGGKSSGEFSGPALNVSGSGAQAGWHYYDLWAGEELPAPVAGQVGLSLE